MNSLAKFLTAALEPETAHSLNLTGLANLMDRYRQAADRFNALPDPRPMICDGCGKQFPVGYLVWLEGPYGDGLWLCKRDYELELTEGRGRR